jgi:hypothetical protein
MSIYEVTYIPDKNTRDNEGCIAKKIILEAHNEIEALKRIAIQIQPHSSHLILKLEGDVSKVREILLINFEICLMVDELEQK